MRDLFTDMSRAAFRVGSDADEATHAGFQDLKGHGDTFGGGGDEFNLELEGKGGRWVSAVSGWALAGRVLTGSADGEIR